MKFCGKSIKFLSVTAFSLMATMAFAQVPDDIPAGDRFPGSFPSAEEPTTTTTTTTPAPGNRPATPANNRPAPKPEETKPKTELPPPDEDRPLNGVVEEKTIIEKVVLPYDNPRESDVMWKKDIWRVIDVREKINQTFTYPEEYFIDILLKGIKDTTLGIRAYSAENDKFHYKLTSKEATEMGESVDTVSIMDPVTYETTYKPVYNKLNPDDIRFFRVKEQWYFDKESSRMFVRILGIAPIQEVKDPTTGAFLFQKPLFWIYYPNCRDYLARHRVFAEGNDASPLSWEDLFEMRRFSSFIFKESNITNRRLQDIYSGRDILLEGEKVKQEIFNWEHDLWSY